VTKLGLEARERVYVSCLQELYQLKKVWVPYYTLYVHCTCTVSNLETILFKPTWWERLGRADLHQLHHLPQVALHTVNRKEANQLKQCKPI